jgi:probable nitrogen fixation protein
MIPASHHAPARASNFLRELARLYRAQGSDGAWDGKTDAELLAPFVVGKDRRRDPSPDGPDPEVFWRIELFYQAVGLAIELRTGVPCTPMLKMHHEGFGRVVLIAGRLVAVSKFLRDAHRFGFESVEALVEAGERLVSAGASMVESFPEAARHAG